MLSDLPNVTLLGTTQAEVKSQQTDCSSITRVTLQCAACFIGSLTLFY
jgi:hypothetical protein